MLAVGLMLMAGCSSSKKSESSSTSTSSGGGVSVTTSSTVAPSHTINIVVNDTSGLNGPMTLVATPDVALAGDVTFIVKNTGTIEHEVIVLKLGPGETADKLPVVDSGDPPVSVATGADKVDESSSVGETGEPNLQPGESRTFVVTGMTAGNYALVCNIAKHYQMGMYAPLTVT
ncbi:MAG: hypothetical protein ACXWB2_05205 [Acidimicrobiales bacterium]